MSGTCPFPLFFYFIICPSLYFISALFTKDGFSAPSIHAVYGRSILFVTGLGTWRYYFRFVMLLLSRSVELWLSIARAAFFRVRRYAILKALLSWDTLTCRWEFFVEFSKVPLGHSDAVDEGITFLHARPHIPEVRSPHLHYCAGLKPISCNIFKTQCWKMLSEILF